jgi:hypothetical protein
VNTPDHAASVDDPTIVDLDATLLTAHSDKEQAAPTFKRGFGFHPLLAFVDHGEHGTSEPLSFLLRRGNAGSNTVTDHIAVARAAFAQLPGHRPGPRPGKTVLARTDGAGCTHACLGWLNSERVQYSVGFTLPDSFAAQLKVLDQPNLWRPALDDDQISKLFGGFGVCGCLLGPHVHQADGCAAEHRASPHPWTPRGRPRYSGMLIWAVLVVS